MFNKNNGAADYLVQVPMTREEVKAFGDWCRLMESEENRVNKSIRIHHYNSNRGGYGHLHVLEPDETMFVLQNELKAANERAVQFENEAYNFEKEITELKKNILGKNKELYDLNEKIKELSTKKRGWL